MEIKIRAYNSNYFPSDKGANFIINVINAGYTFGNPNLNIKLTDAAFSTLSFYDLEYVTEGICHIESCGKTHSISAGELFFINKGTPRIIYSDKKKPVKKFFISFKGSLADALIQSYGLTEGILILKIDAMERFLKLLEILGAAESYDADAEEQIAAELLKLLHAVYRKKESPNVEHIKYDCSADDILKYIDMNLGRKFSLEEICDQFYISRAKLWRIFKEKYEITPLKYLQARRMEKAKYYLLHTNHPVSTLYETIGLSDSKYFFQLFKKETGMSPLKFREKFLGMNNITSQFLKNPQAELSLRKTGDGLRHMELTDLLKAQKRTGSE